jgi:hypothetical protein
MIFAENSLIQWRAEDNGNDRIDRIIAIRDKLAWTISIYGKSAWPIPQKLSHLQQSLSEGLVTFLEDDPFLELKVRSDDRIPANQRQSRDKWWSAFEASLENADLLSRYGRTDFIREVARAINCHPKTVRKYLRRWLQLGMVPNALLPLYQNSGAPGKTRNSRTGKRLGRYRKQELKDGTGKTGMPVDAEIEDIFAAAIKLYYETQTAPSLPFAYQRMWEKFFSEEVVQPDGKKKRQLLPLSQIPSIDQFRYWYNRTYNPTRNIKSRRGQKEFDSNSRPKTGRVTDLALRPGHIYVMDYTVADVSLVSWETADLDGSRWLQFTDHRGACYPGRGQLHNRSTGA